MVNEQAENRRRQISGMLFSQIEGSWLLPACWLYLWLHFKYFIDCHSTNKTIPPISIDNFSGFSIFIAFCHVRFLIHWLNKVLILFANDSSSIKNIFCVQTPNYLVQLYFETEINPDVWNIHKFSQHDMSRLFEQCCQLLSHAVRCCWGKYINLYDLL